MGKALRVSIVAALVFCFVAQANVSFAGGDAQAKTPTPAVTTLNLEAAIAASHLEFAPGSAQIFQGRPYGLHNRSGSVAALMLGAAATITGTALLVYANRPECSVNQSAGACGYGTKVIGTSVLVGGVAGLFVGAMMWR